MNREIRKFILYIKMSLLFMILGFITLYFAGVPLVSYIISHGKMIMIKGAPGYPEGFAPEVSKLEMIKNSALDMSEIQKPALETQYGTILCERIALTVPLYFGDSEAPLQLGAGQYPGSGLPGQGKPILISGHDGTFFAPLEQIETDDIVNITTAYGSFNYQVVDIKITDATDTAAYDLNQDKEQLILYTCYPFGGLIGDRSGRFFVYCDPLTAKEEQ